MEKASELKQLLRNIEVKPLIGDDFDKFYVEATDTRHMDPAMKICDYLESYLDVPRRVLFIGQAGCGKSTELWKVRRYLSTDFKVLYFSIKTQWNVTDITYIELVFYIMDKLLDEVLTLNIRLDDTLLDSIIEFWQNENLFRSLDIHNKDFTDYYYDKVNYMNYIRGAISNVLLLGAESKEHVKKYMDPKMSSLIKYINNILFNIRKASGQNKTFPVIILDELDKLNFKESEDLFIKHRNVLTLLNAHLICTFPLYLRYTNDFKDIEETFGHYEFLNMIKVYTKQGQKYKAGAKTLKDIIAKRADLKLFEEGVLDYIIDKSGGSLTSLFELIKHAALDVRSRNISSFSIDMEAANNAYKIYKSEFQRYLSEKSIEVLSNLYNDTNKTPLSNETLRELLYMSCVLEYDSERWCDIHPVISDILQNRGIINTGRWG
ncbi:hypothetical protein MCHI_003556 [Candidatus Magnetoovum chiemensis]|nr:hypothetical protein MCHI_003556 [Candidatus Magnetoovum chiemensis]